MLRYFVAGNFWLAFTLVLLLARGYAPNSNGQTFTVFGVGHITPEVFWLAAIAGAAATVACVIAWRSSARPAV